MKEGVDLSVLRVNISQKKVAKSLGISKSYLSLLENGKRRMSLDLASEMANLYGVTVEEILKAYNVCKESTIQVVNG